MSDLPENPPFDAATRAQLMRQIAVEFAPRLVEYAPIKRAALLDGLSLLLTGEESEHARYAAHVLRQAEEAQTTFLDLL